MIIYELHLADGAGRIALKLEIDWDRVTMPDRQTAYELIERLLREGGRGQARRADP